MMASKFVSTLQLVSFDVTGTLIKFRVPPPHQYAAVANMYNIHVEPEKLSISFKTSFKQMNLEHPNFGKASGLGWEKWWHRVVCRTLQLGAEESVLDAKKLDIVARHLISGYSSGSYYELYPHVKELLQSLRDKGITLCVISNNDDRLPKVLDSLGLLQYFSFVLTSYNVGFAKPMYQIFQKALENNNVSPEHALHVGNDPTNDYLAAVKCGWSAALVHKEDGNNVVSQHSDILPHLIFNNLKDLQKFLS